MLQHKKGIAANWLFKYIFYLVLFKQMDGRAVCSVIAVVEILFCRHIQSCSYQVQFCDFCNVDDRRQKSRKDSTALKRQALVSNRRHLVPPNYEKGWT